MKKSKENVTKNIIEAVMNYLERKCNYCGSVENLHIHHILPLSKGGQNSLGNFEVVCRTCHLKLHHQIEKVLPKKYIPVIFYCEKCGVKFFKKINTGEAVCPYCKGQYITDWTRKYRERKKDIIELKEEGKTYQEIGKVFNLSRQRIYQIINTDYFESP